MPTSTRTRFQETYLGADHHRTGRGAPIQKVWEIRSDRVGKKASPRQVQYDIPLAVFAASHETSRLPFRSLAVLVGLGFGDRREPREVRQRRRGRWLVVLAEVVLQDGRQLGRRILGQHKTWNSAEDDPVRHGSSLDEPRGLEHQVLEDGKGNHPPREQWVIATRHVDSFRTTPTRIEGRESGLFVSCIQILLFRGGWTFQLSFDLPGVLNQIPRCFIIDDCRSGWSARDHVKGCRGSRD